VCREDDAREIRGPAGVIFPVAGARGGGRGRVHPCGIGLAWPGHPHFRGAVDADGVVETVGHEAVAELHRRAIRRVRENDLAGQLVIESADHRDMLHPRSDAQADADLAIGDLACRARVLPLHSDRMRPLPEEAGVINDPGRHRRVLGHRGDRMTRSLPPNGLIRPQALSEEMEEPILRALRAVRVTAGGVPRWALRSCAPRRPRSRRSTCTPARDRVLPRMTGRAHSRVQEDAGCRVG